MFIYCTFLIIYLPNLASGYFSFIFWEPRTKRKNLVIIKYWHLNVQNKHLYISKINHSRFDNCSDKVINIHYNFTIPSIAARALGHSILKSSPDSCNLASFFRMARAPIDLQGSNQRVNTLNKYRNKWTSEASHHRKWITNGTSIYVFQVLLLKITPIMLCSSLPSSSLHLHGGFGTAV